MPLSPSSAAFFDVDRTLVGPGTMERTFVSYLIRRRYLRAPDLARYLSYLARNLGGLDGGLVRRNKYHLRHKDPAELEGLAAECFQSEIRPRISPEGRRRVECHRARGQLVVLLTGSLRPLAEELARELQADLALAAELAVESGAFSGILSKPHPYGPEKARLVRELARERGLDLQGSFAYGDHHSDLHVLACVGHPYAVNPHPRLRQQAVARGWPILQF